MKAKTFEHFINEAFNINIGEYADISKSEETKTAKNFSWSPVPVTVKNIDADIIDDYNTTIDIDLSNGDTIEYYLKERSNKKPGDSAPPYTDFYLKINGEVFEKETEWMADFSTGSIVGTILSYYSDFCRTRYNAWKSKSFAVK